MSHHFDTKLAKEDPSLNLCDSYLFDGPSDLTQRFRSVADALASLPDETVIDGEAVALDEQGTELQSASNYRSAQSRRTPSPN
jgi:hypothetical protein